MDANTTVCVSVENAYQATRLESLRAPAPEIECMTKKAYDDATNVSCKK